MTAETVILFVCSIWLTLSGLALAADAAGAAYRARAAYQQHKHPTPPPPGHDSREAACFPAQARGWEK